jgi:hypothetical protein
MVTEQQNLDAINVFFIIGKLPRFSNHD